MHPWLRVIIECLMFTAQQNIPQRGHTECRSNLSSASDFNRGNFLELLHLRCKDNPWLSKMLQSKLGEHTQWTSPGIQDELLALLSDFVRKRILTNVRASEEFGLIMDETSDISRAEQVSICLSYLLGDERKETFIGFYKTKSTTGEALHDLLCDMMQ